MNAMQKLTREDLYSLEEYSEIRDEFRNQVLSHKRNRRVEIILQAPESPKPQKTEISDPIRGNGPIVKNPVFQ